MEKKTLPPEIEDSIKKLQELCPDCGGMRQVRNGPRSYGPCMKCSGTGRNPNVPPVGPPALKGEPRPLTDVEKEALKPFIETREADIALHYGTYEETKMGLRSQIEICNDLRERLQVCEAQLQAANERAERAENSYRCYHCKQLFPEGTDHFGKYEEMPKCLHMMRGGSGGGIHDAYVRVRKDVWEKTEAELADLRAEIKGEQSMEKQNVSTPEGAEREELPRLSWSGRYKKDSAFDEIVTPIIIEPDVPPEGAESAKKTGLDDGPSNSIIRYDRCKCKSGEPCPQHEAESMDRMMEADDATKAAQHPSVSPEGKQEGREEPYRVEPDGQHACDKCSAGTQWMVVFAPTDTAESTSYGLKEDAEDVAGMLNAAYRNALAASIAPQPQGESALPSLEPSEEDTYAAFKDHYDQTGEKLPSDAPEIVVNSGFKCRERQLLAALERVRELDAELQQKERA